MQDPVKLTTGADVAPALAEGRYRLLSELGEGGAARVYLALDTDSGRDCAIKVLRQDGPGEDLQERFAREGEVLTRLAHPNLVTIEAVGQDGDRDYLVMELVEGGSLQDRLESEGPLGSFEVRKILLDVLAALAEVHRHRIVHRDVKPGNLLLTADGSVKLADFGIARIEGSLTRTGATVGTYAFMAPEQLEDPRGVGPAADLYAAAATAIGLALGQPPFGLQDPERRAELLEQLDPELARVLARALLRDPDDRWSSADDMARALGGDVSLAPARTDTRRLSLVLVAVLVPSILLFIGLAQPDPPSESAPFPPPLAPALVVPESEPSPTPQAAPVPARVERPAPVVAEPERELETRPQPAPESEPEPLPPAPVEVFIQSLPWSELYVDGAPRGRTGRFVSLRPGDHQVRLVRPDGAEMVTTLAVPTEGETRFCWDFDEEAACPGR